uniref:Neuferricin n=1 Tax=Monopterus albus TaxID=43700 RepID=A0A3Q3Q199_MONAL
MLSYVLVAFISVSLAVLFIPLEWSHKFGNESTQDLHKRLLTRSELSFYDGEEGSRGLYLAILGQVFDVHKGHKHYGPGGAYHFMAGKDVSLAFITGDFTESGLTDDVSSLSPLQVLALYDWLSFYQREYQPVGIVCKYYKCIHPQLALHIPNPNFMEIWANLRMRKQADTSLFSSTALCRRVCWEPEGPVLQQVASQPWRT